MFVKVKQYAFSDTENNMTFCIGVCWLGTPNMESLQKIMMNLNIIDKDGNNGS